MTDKRRRHAVWLEGRGIEVGALSHPLAVPPGAAVTYVDRLAEADLRRHYPELEKEPLVHVDVIATAEDLSPFADGSQDFVIANHLFEHLENPIRALHEFARVLRPGGILYLALPDRRQTFDRDRPVTPLEHLLDEHEHGAERNRAAHYREWAELVDHKPPEQVEEHARKLLEQGYSIHFHVWEPDSFLDFFTEVRRRFSIPLQLLALAAPESENDNELICILARPTADGRPRFRPVQPTVAERVALPTLRTRLAGSPLGPPVRMLKRAVRGGPPT